MGVDGLIKFLQPIIKKQHLSSFKNKTAAIDMSSWLYRSCYNAADQMNSQPQSTSFLFYIHQLIDLLEYYQIKMICVFDGRYLVHKQDTVNKRKTDRESNRKRGEELLEKGEEEEGKKFINRCIKIDERIVTVAMRALSGRKIPYIVAPYQSDSQMAKLNLLGLADFTICEDSDLIIYGVPVLLKLSNEGECDYFNINEVEIQKIDNVFIKQFMGLSKKRRTEVAVLAGTDYLPSIRGIGIKKALKFICQSQDFSEAIGKISGIERFNKQKPENYDRRAEEALLIFQYATAYNPNSHKLQFLNQKSEEENKSTQQILSLVGLDYGYDQKVSQGQKHIWTLQSRQLPPIPYDGMKVFNLQNIKEKEMEFQNTRLMRNRVRTRSSLKMTEQKQQELQMMCQSRAQLKKRQSIKNSLEELCQEGMKRSLRRSQSKQQKFKQKFPSWMNYVPQKKKQFPGSQQ